MIVKRSFGVDAKRDKTNAAPLHKAAPVLYLLRRGPVFFFFFILFSRIHSVEQNKENVCASVRASKRALGVCQSRNWEALWLDLWGEGLPRVPVQNNSSERRPADGQDGTEALKSLRLPLPHFLFSTVGPFAALRTFKVSAYLLLVSNYGTI